MSFDKTKFVGVHLQRTSEQEKPFSCNFFSRLNALNQQSSHGVIQFKPPTITYNGIIDMEISNKLTNQRKRYWEINGKSIVHGYIYFTSAKNYCASFISVCFVHESRHRLLYRPDKIRTIKIFK